MDRVEYHPLVIQDILNHHKAEELELDPWYQRRSVWTRPQKAYLINTIFEKKPVPSLYIRHSLDMDKEKSVKEVVDGQQRIRSILEYVDNEFPALHPKHDEPVKYKELSGSEKSDFRMTALSVGTLYGATDSDVIEIFGRLNSVAKTLNLQEKRNAQYSGAFKQFCLREAAKRLPVWRNLGIFTANDIARMTEVQFVSELIINMLDGLRDYSTKEIDEYYEENDDAFQQRPSMSRRLEKLFAKVASIEPAAIRDTVFARSPIFFSLCIILDDKPALNAARLTRALYKIDASFSSDTPLHERSKADAEFYVACTSNMHRIKSRSIRDKYIRKSL